jgi:ABC-type antimicrobial peptide transport system permease subunit
MQDSFQSSLIFFRAHKGAVTLLIASLSMVFFACLILHSLSRITIMEQEKYGADYARMYEIDYEPADREMTNQVLDYLHRSGFPIKELCICGEVELINPSRVEAGEAGTIDYTAGGVVSHNGNVSTAIFPLIGFDIMPISSPEIYRGSAEMGGNNVLIDEWDYSGLFGGWALYGEESEDILYLANGETRNVAGVVWIPSYLLYSGILADKDQFFTMTDTSSSLRVIFSSNLTEQDEQELIRNVRQYVSLNDVVYPSDNDFFSSGESDILTALSRVLIFVCLLCSMRLMTYLFLLRKQEFSVIRMLGAGQARIAGHILTMILMVSGISISVGTIAYLILDASHVADTFLPKLTLPLIGSDALFMILSALIIGLAMFFTNLKVDVTRANEEV